VRKNKLKAQSSKRKAVSALVKKTKLQLSEIHEIWTWCHMALSFALYALSLERIKINWNPLGMRQLKKKKRLENKKISLPLRSRKKIRSAVETADL